MAMGDKELKTELPNDVLAPSETIRNDLVATAVKFLQNPKVQNSPLSQKRSFLQKKGLTPEEINAAVDRAGIQQQDIATSVQTDKGYKDKVQISSPAPVPIREAKFSTLVKARNIAVLVTAFTGLSYVAYKLYKEFIQPWLFRTQRVEALERSVREALANVTASLSSIEQKLESQQEKLLVISHDINSKESGESIATLQCNSSLREIKTELSSLKGLLLSRRQFPPIPQTAPVLPSWQLHSSSEDTKSNTNLMSHIATEESLNISPKITFSENPAKSLEKSESEINSSECNKDLSIETMNTTCETGEGLGTVKVQFPSAADESIKSMDFIGETGKSLNSETDCNKNEADVYGQGERSEDKVIGENPNNNNIEN